MRDRGLSHNLNDGERGVTRHEMTPILVADTHGLPSTVSLRFSEAAQDLATELTASILLKIKEFIELEKSKRPTNRGCRCRVAPPVHRESITTFGACRRHRHLY
jgi:hypothetical protein